MSDARNAFGVSPEQLRAMDLSRLVFLSAAAGSGKTRVLVARFLWALENEHGNIDAVTAITFTEKAAAELLERVRSEVRRRAERGDGELWRRALESMPRARISTIHGFCARLLKEHALDMHLDPDFEQADAATFAILADEAIAATLDALGRQPLDGDGALLYRALGDVALPALREHLCRLHERRDLAVPWARCMTEAAAAPLPSAEELVGAVQALHDRADATERWLARPLARHAAIRNLRDVLAPLPLPTNARKFAPSVQRVREALARGDAEYADTELQDALCDLADRTAPKSWGEACLAQFDVAMRPVRPIVPHLRDAVTEPDELEARRASYLRDLARLFLISLAQLEQLKAKRRLLDFQDLQEKTLALLEREAPRAKIQSRLKHLLVDEFQDTDPLQWEIMLHLFGNGEQLDRRGLCLVGDEKQSIYAFRSAEVALCKQARTAIADANRRLLLEAARPCLPTDAVKLSAAEASGLFELEESYRFLPGLARFHNDLFANLFPREPQRDFEARFAPMQAVGEQASIARAARIEMLLAPDESEGPTLVARRVGRLLDEQPIVYDKEQRADRPLRAGDVAILLRSRRKLAEIERSLTREGVPYLVTGGLGYFARPEVIDLMNLVQFASRTADSVALLGLLRSPFVALDDTSIYGVARAAGGPLWHRLERCCATGSTLLDDARMSEVRRAHQWLSDLVERAGWMPPADWVRHGCERSGFLIALAASSRAQSDLLNVEKFFDIVRALGLRGLSLFEIATWLGKHVDANLLEGEAEPEEATLNLVKVMTVHASKGLEFPVVVVPDLGFTLPSASGDGLILLGTRDAPLVTAKLADDGNDYYKKKLGTRYLVEREKVDRDLAEERRVLYVALTRAQEHLILQGTEALQSQSLQAWIDRALGGVSARADVRTLGAHDLLPRPLSLVRSEPPPAERDVALIAPRISPLPEPHLTATSVGELLRCPRKFYYADLLAIPERIVLPDRRPVGTHAPALTPFVRGRLVHRMLQHLVDRDVGANEANSLARRFAQDEGIGDEAVVTWVADAAMRAASDFMRSEAGTQLGKAKAVFRERSFELSLAGARVTGQIDLMVETRDGRCLIIDYKTDEGVGSEALALDLAVTMGYRDQLLLYALAVEILLKPKAIDTYLFFTHAGRTIPAADCSPLQLAAFRARLGNLLAQAQSDTVDAAYPVTSNEATCDACGFKARKICAKWAGAGLGQLQ